MAKGKYADWITGDGLLVVQDWARHGLTNEQIAHNIGVRPETIARWQNDYPQFGQALKRARYITDLQIENALHRRAEGYTVIERVRERVWDKNENEYVFVTTQEKERYIPPDTAAQIFWLKNRRPDDWRDKREIKTMGSLEQAVGPAFMDALTRKAADVLPLPEDVPDDLEDTDDE